MCDIERIARRETRMMAGRASCPPRDRTFPIAFAFEDRDLARYAMNIMICLLAGAIVGWLSLSFLHFNEARSKFVCILIGAMGGFIGAKLVAPMFFGPAPAGELFSMAPIFTAVLVASAFMAIGDWVNKRWDV
jgi:uncharacterized membrane protein YeaQ/YmgE (transglycosylase-associated protein family)